MNDSLPHHVDSADEGRHQPGAEELWNESVYLDAVSADGSLGAYVRVGLYPNLGVTWWTAAVVGPDRPTLSSQRFDLPVAGGSGLVLGTGTGTETGTETGGSEDGTATGSDVTDRTDVTDKSDEMDMAIVIAEPLQRVRVTGFAPAVRLDHPRDAYGPTKGDSVRLGLDLTWLTDGIPYHYDITTRYEIPCHVSGTVTVGDEVLVLEGPGQRDHSWGVRDWWAFGWCWFAGCLEDGTRIHGADIRIPGSPMTFGYVQESGGVVAPVTRLEVSEDLDGDGLATSTRIVMEPSGLDLTATVQGWGPILLVSPDGRRSRFPRAQMTLVAADGRHGSGWIEWNQPEPPGDGQ